MTDSSMSEKKKRHEHVTEKLYDAEHALEEAIIVCDDQEMRGHLLGEYRGLLHAMFQRDEEWEEEYGDCKE